MVTNRRQLGLVLATLVVLPWAQTGCHDPQASAALAYRRQQIRHTVQFYTQREADSPGLMQRTLRTVEETERRHAEKHEANRGRLADWARRDIRRWRDNQARYRQRIADQLAGDPENMKRSIRAMFY